MRVYFYNQEENVEHGAGYGYENSLGIVIYTGRRLRMIVSDKQLQNKVERREHKMRRG